MRSCPPSPRWRGKDVEGFAVRLFERERDSLFDVFGFARGFDHYRRFFFWLAPEQSIERDHAAGQHRANRAIALGGTTHHVRIVG